MQLHLMRLYLGISQVQCSIVHRGWWAQRMLRSLRRSIEFRVKWLAGISYFAIYLFLRLSTCLEGTSNDCSPRPYYINSDMYYTRPTTHPSFSRMKSRPNSWHLLFDMLQSRFMQLCHSVFKQTECEWDIWIIHYSMNSEQLLTKIDKVRKCSSDVYSLYPTWK